MLPESSDRPVDLLVIGGGITGAGVALDAALRGLRVALVEQGDFAGGTSSASSKLIHGGLRYLERGHVRLVGESLAERRLLLRNAPHLVHPLRFVLPFVRGGVLPMWKGRAGLWMYDWLAGSGNLPASRRLSTAGLRRDYPGLRAPGLVGGSAYWDAQTDDARLTLAVALAAARAGAAVSNHAAVTELLTENGTVRGAVIRDRIDGRTVTVTARVVLNAAGPWADAVRRLADPSAEPLLSPTKGVHIVLPGNGLSDAFLLHHPDDGRVFFAIPWLGRTLVGTTDTPHEGGPETPAVTPAEIAYLLAGYNAWFGPARMPSDVRASFAGLRPLLRSDGAASDRSRDWQLIEGPAGLLTVAGGKLTAWRHMAERIADTVCARLGVRVACRTRTFRLDRVPVGEWSAVSAGLVASLERNGVPAELAAHLVGRYGGRAAEAAAVIGREGAFRRQVVPGEPDVLGEWAYQREAEMAHAPADLLLRRTRLGLFYPHLLRKRAAG